ncbi:MAG: 50S ribosomal protein L11 methyltransferase, partial [Candidatus Binataceae bacterium]
MPSPPHQRSYTRAPQRSYTKVAFTVPGLMADEAAGMLAAYGALGCAVERVPASAGEPRDSHARLEAYFNQISPALLKAVSRKMADAGMAVRAVAPSIQQLTDPGWATLWMGRFKPLEIGRRLLIVPPWSEAQETDRIRIVIRPGQGFGTGHHPTTAGALMAIERLCAKARYKKALDVGAGSGVLAIAMRLFGVGTVAAIDNDPAALENARENAALNKMDGLRISAARLNSFKRQRFDLISANILSSTLIAMAPAL